MVKDLKRKMGDETFCGMDQMKRGGESRIGLQRHQVFRPIMASKGMSWW